MKDEKPPHLKLVSTESPKESREEPSNSQKEVDGEPVAKVYDALIEALVAASDPESVFYRANKILIIGLFDENLEYQYSVIQGGAFKGVEMVSLLEMVKSKLLHEINNNY